MGGICLNRNLDIDEKPLTKIKDKREESSAEKETEEHGTEDIAVLEHSRWERSLVSLPELDSNENSNHKTKANE
jgi:hypothetical protein